MNSYLFTNQQLVYCVQSSEELSTDRLDRLAWLLEAEQHHGDKLTGKFVGPRATMVTPWSSNVCDIAHNIGLPQVRRVESFRRLGDGAQPATPLDPMLEQIYHGLSGESLVVQGAPEPIRSIAEIEKYNSESGLALSPNEIGYLKGAGVAFGRPFTDSELFSFAQINSEHCRHKIFNGKFVIDGVEHPHSLFELIKQTSAKSPNGVVSAYKDNVAFIAGPEVLQFSSPHPERADNFLLTPIRSVISLKAETHNFPTTVEPFFGASTGSGGEIRDRMAGGRGSMPISGGAVYMTAYPRLGGVVGHGWEQAIAARKWRYQSPAQILIKASNGASDFGNKFGQPLIFGSLFTFEGKLKFAGGDRELLYAYDRCVMLAGGVGYASAEHAQKADAAVGDLLLVLGGDNYRIGMAGSSVSSVDSGSSSEAIEQSAVQRANPEMQKRVANVCRALVEIGAACPVKLIHDHGAGGHINCFAELLHPQGGRIAIEKLPVGDPTLSYRELLSNESQERMGLIVSPEQLGTIQAVAKRERAPLFVVGEVLGTRRMVCESAQGERPIDVPMEFFFGSSPATTIEDRSAAVELPPDDIKINSSDELLTSLKEVLSLEAVACKDWLTNKVDRCVTGKVARQQCVGPLQLPLSNVALTRIDHSGVAGIASAIGHASAPGLVDPAAGAVLSVAEALTNLVWAEWERPDGVRGLRSVVLSANWMWPAKQQHENARLYQAVSALSTFCQQIGVAVPTGKDSLSMTMNYPPGSCSDGDFVRAPGTVVVTAVAPSPDVRSCVTPDLKQIDGSTLLYVNLSCDDANPLGGSSLGQVRSLLVNSSPTVRDPKRFAAGLECLQQLVREGKILAGHDVSSGGLIVALCEMAFGGDIGFKCSISEGVSDSGRFLFCEKPGVVLQVAAEDVGEIERRFKAVKVDTEQVGAVGGDEIRIKAGKLKFGLPHRELLRVWYKPSYQLDRLQTRPDKADERFRNIFKGSLNFSFPAGFSGRGRDYGVDLRRVGSSVPPVRAAIIREQGTNGERELAFALHAAGFDVKDVTMSDLVSGDERLDAVNLVAFPGGFANSDVLGSARGWAGVFRYNAAALETIQRFVGRPNTLSLGVCNGCQLMVNLDLVYPEHREKIRMLHNESGKFESIFLNVDVRPTKSVMLQPLVGTRLGVWVSHGEGRFDLPEGESAYDIPVRYVASDYPINPNGADFNAAAICSADGRHLAIMPHLERSTVPTNWGFYPEGKLKMHEISPWMLAFAAAREWIKERR